MAYSTEHMTFLWEQYLNKQATPAEVEALFALLRDEANEALSVDTLQAAMRGQPLPDTLSEEQKQHLLANLLAAMPVSAPAEATATTHSLPNQPPVDRIHYIRKAWLRYAAVLLLVVGSAALIYQLSRRFNPEPVLAKNEQPVTGDIGPGTEKALLTLADGTTIALDHMGSGAIARQGNAEVIKLDNGQVRYDVKGPAGREAVWNTMTTPRGGLYSLVLPDGTKVWLNAASSITFPTAFTGAERKVKVSGEAYLEVATHKEKPFLVDVDGRSLVQVLGTSFNINAYADEPATRTTLLEGSLRVSRTDTKASALIRPGQEAVITHAGTTKQAITVAEADLQGAVAWKNGLFHFTNADLPAVVRQLEKWYNIEVAFEGAIPDVQLIGEMKRGVKLSTILSWFADLGIQTRQEGRKVIIL